MRTIHFNTGRKYTEHGQRISATLDDEGVVTFWDHDRHIDGIIYTIAPEDFSRATVLSAYDNGLYHNSEKSWLDGATRFGCNGTWEDLA